MGNDWSHCLRRDRSRWAFLRATEVRITEHERATEHERSDPDPHEPGRRPDIDLFRLDPCFV